MSENETGGKRFIGLLGQNTSFISAFNIAQVCLTWFVFFYTRSAVDVGLVAIVESVMVLLVSLPIGTMVDRLNKGMLLVVSGTTGFAVFLFLSVYAYFLPFELTVVLVLSALWGASREISRSASLSALPDLVENMPLSRANGIFRAFSSTMGSVSNALAGGLIVTLGIISGFLFSAGAYLLSAIFAAVTIFPFLKKRKSGEDEEHNEPGRMIADLKEGFRWLTGRRGFFLLTVSATFFNFFMEMAVTFFVIYVAVGLDASPFIFGIVLSAYAVGDVSGSLFAGRVDLLRHSGKINVVLYGGVPGACILLLGLVPLVWVAILFTFIAGFCLGISINLWLTSAHNIVPPDMRGRYFALDGVLSSISPAAIAAGAFVVSAIGIVNDFILSGALMLVSTAVFSGMRSLWTLDGRSKGHLEYSLKL